MSKPTPVRLSKLRGIAAQAFRGMIIALGLATMTVLSGVLSVEIAKTWSNPPHLAAAQEVSRIVVDRNDNLLRPFTASDGRWRLPIKQANVDQRYIDMLLAFEDKRFYDHGGVDITAMTRAAVQFITNGRIISGASTLTMQVARLIERRHERSLQGKIRQIIRARQLESVLSKHELLELYLRLAPFGGNIEGVRAASLAYFGKEPKRLSVGQAALLVALPQSPEWRRPDRHQDAARTARNRVILRARASGILSEAEAERGLSESIPNKRRPFPMLAPHLAEKELRAQPQVQVHRLTIDRQLQSELEKLARDHAQLLGEKLSVAVIAVENKTGAIIAHVGAADYLNSNRNGPIDMVNAVRSPGSTLKPIIYGLGFEAGVAHPETLIEDRPARFGRYAPKNFDQDYRGTITVRDALAQSVNVPAIKVLDAVGAPKLVARMRRAGAKVELPADTEPSLAIGLGGVGLRLHDLATIYTSLANGGRYTKLFHRKGEDQQRRLSGAIASDLRKQLMTPVAAWYVTDILKDAPAPDHARSGRVAYKTGTSYGYRDALAVGLDGKHTIAVWVGRADGTSVPGLVGRIAAAPILFDAFARIGSTRAALPGPPAGALRVSYRDLPPPLKRFERTTETHQRGPFTESPVVISFPLDRSEIEVDVSPATNGANNASASPVMLKAKGGTLPLIWLVDGKVINAQAARDIFWRPSGVGFSRLTVIDATGQVDRVNVRIKKSQSGPLAMPRGRLTIQDRDE